MTYNLQLSEGLILAIFRLIFVTYWLCYLEIYLHFSLNFEARNVYKFVGFVEVNISGYPEN